MVFNATFSQKYFSYIVAVRFIVGVPGEKHWPDVSH